MYIGLPNTSFGKEIVFSNDTLTSGGTSNQWHRPRLRDRRSVAHEKYLVQRMYSTSITLIFKVVH